MLKYMQCNNVSASAHFRSGASPYISGITPLLQHHNTDAVMHLARLHVDACKTCVMTAAGENSV